MPGASGAAIRQTGNNLESESVVGLHTIIRIGGRQAAFLEERNHITMYSPSFV